MEDIMIDEKILKAFSDNAMQAQKFLDLKPAGIKNMGKSMALRMMMSVLDTNEEGEYNVSKLAKDMNIANPNLTHILNELQMEDYITRRREGRHVFVKITEKGERYYKDCMEGVKKYLTLLFDELHASGVSDEEINEFMATSIKLKNAQQTLKARLKAESNT